MGLIKATAKFPAFVGQAGHRHIAVIVRDDLANEHDPAVHRMAGEFYEEIENFVKEAGFFAIVDAGKPFTHPDQRATLVVVHGTGINRRRHIPPWANFITLETRSPAGERQRDRAAAALFFQLSHKDRVALKEVLGLDALEVSE